MNRKKAPGNREIRVCMDLKMQLSYLGLGFVKLDKTKTLGLVLKLKLDIWLNHKTLPFKYFKSLAFSQTMQSIPQGIPMPCWSWSWFIFYLLFPLNIKCLGHRNTKQHHSVEFLSHIWQSKKHNWWDRESLISQSGSCSYSMAGRSCQGHPARALRFTTGHGVSCGP